MSEAQDEDVNSSPTGRAVLGTLCLYGSFAILFLAIVSSSSSLSFMPRSWFTNRWSWYLAGFAGFGLHLNEVDLTQGNLIDLIRSEASGRGITIKPPP